MRARSPFIVAIAAGLIVGLCACAPERDPEENPSEAPTSASPTPTTTPSSSAEPEEPAPGDEPATPVTQSCDELISPQAMYDYNPNFSFVSQGKANYEGVACNWINGTSSEKIALTVARPGKTDREALAASAATKGSSAPALGSTAYFGSSGGVGTATVFEGDHVIVFSSTYFFSAGDVEPLVDEVTSALGL